MAGVQARTLVYVKFVTCATMTFPPKWKTAGQNLLWLQCLGLKKYIYILANEALCLKCLCFCKPAANFKGLGYGEIMPGPWWKLHSLTPPTPRPRTAVGQFPAGLSRHAFMRAAVRHPLVCVRQPSRLLDRSRVRGEGEWKPGLSGSVLPPPPPQPALPSNLGNKGVNVPECYMVSQATDSLCIAPFCFPSAPLSPTRNPTCRHATSIWFDFMEMFILLSKYPFIALGMELDVLLDWAGQITTGMGKLLPHPKS